MTGSAPHETVLVGVDGSAASAAAVRWAAAEAERRGARLHAVHVVERPRTPGPRRYDDVSRQVELARQTIPGRVGGWVFRAGIDVGIAVSVVTGDAGAQLAREAVDASLVVIGAPDSLHHSALPLDLASRCLCQVVMVGTFGDLTYVEAPVMPSRREARHARR